MKYRYAQLLVLLSGAILNAGAVKSEPAAILPPPQVELDVVSILANFPRAERRYVQLILHTGKEFRVLSEECARKAAVLAQKDLPEKKPSQDFDLVEVSRYGQAYLSCFNPVRLYLVRAYKRLASASPPARFQQAHRYLLDYLAGGLENWQSMSPGLKASTKPAHDPAELWRIRTLSGRTYKENGLDVSIYLLN